MKAKEILKRTGLKQRELAKKLLISRSLVGRLMTDDIELSERVAKRIAKVFKLQILWDEQEEFHFEE